MVVKKSRAKKKVPKKAAKRAPRKVAGKKKTGKSAALSMEQKKEAVADLIRDYLDSFLALVMAFDRISERVVSLEISQTSITARWRQKGFLEGTPCLDGTTIPETLSIDDSIYKLVWASASDCAAVSDACEIEDEGYNLEELSWDELSPDEFKSALGKFDPLTEGEALLEWYENVDDINWGSYPKRLLPFLRRCVAAVPRP